MPTACEMQPLRQVRRAKRGLPSCLTSVLFHFPFQLFVGHVTVSLLVLGLLLTCENLCPCGLLCVISELLAGGSPGFRTVLCCFFLMSLVWRFVLCLVLLFSSLAIPIHLMMHKSLSTNRAGRVNFIVPLVVLVFLVGFCVWFFALVFVFSVSRSARDDDLVPCMGPPTVS